MCSIEVDMYKCFFLEICWSEGHSLGLSGFGQVDEVRVIVLGQSYVM